jgi:hypothetical protein
MEFGIYALNVNWNLEISLSCSYFILYFICLLIYNQSKGKKGFCKARQSIAKLGLTGFYLVLSLTNSGFKDAIGNKWHILLK